MGESWCESALSGFPFTNLEQFLKWEGMARKNGGREIQDVIELCLRGKFGM